MSLVNHYALETFPEMEPEEIRTLTNPVDILAPHAVPFGQRRIRRHKICFLTCIYSNLGASLAPSLTAFVSVRVSCQLLLGLSVTLDDVFRGVMRTGDLLHYLKVVFVASVFFTYHRDSHLALYGLSFFQLSCSSSSLWSALGWVTPFRSCCRQTGSHATADGSVLHLVSWYSWLYIWQLFLAGSLLK